MVASYSEWYEEGEIEHMNGVWLLQQLKLIALRNDIYHVKGVASLRVTIKVPCSLATLAFGLAPHTAWSSCIIIIRRVIPA